MKCRAYAKALHYKEDEFHRKPTVPVLEALISINNKLVSCIRVGACEIPVPKWSDQGEALDLHLKNCYVLTFWKILMLGSVTIEMLNFQKFYIWTFQNFFGNGWSNTKIYFSDLL